MSEEQILDETTDKYQVRCNKIQNVAEEQVKKRREFLSRLDRNTQRFEESLVKLRLLRNKKLQELEESIKIIEVWTDPSEGPVSEDPALMSETLKHALKAQSLYSDISKIDSKILRAMEEIRVRKDHIQKIEKNISRYLGHIARWSKENLESLSEQTEVNTETGEQ